MHDFRRTAQLFFVLAIFFATALLANGCGDIADTGGGPPTTRASNTANFGNVYNAKDTWLVQVYLCGSDLETNSAAATSDLQEMLEVKLPENVKVLIQTGGSNQWQNDTVSSSAIERYLYTANGLERITTLPDADMGDVNTLTDFIKFGVENYEADHQIFIFWDHGGGSVAGVCWDERTGNNLSLNDIRTAFTTVYETSTEAPPFEIIGFDACLMATYDTVNTLDGLTRYVVASEEVEPGIGWNYAGWIKTLAENTALGGAGVGKAICDSYMTSCEEYDVDDTATLSVIDMSKLPELRNAYESFGLEALRTAHQNPRAFFSQYGRGATNAENYGGNTRKTGYTNMVDIADLAKSNKEILPATSDKLISAIDSAVVYSICGDYRNRSNGLAGYHSYNGDAENLVGYMNIDSAPNTQKFLYYYLIFGQLPDEVVPLLSGDTLVTPAPTTAPAQKEDLFKISDLEDMVVQKDENNNTFVKLTAEQMEMLSSVHCILAYMDLDSGLVIHLGYDTDINADWNTGIFTDNFRGVWPMLDGHPVYIEITEENDEYNLYSIPIKLNGVECNLQVAYVYKEEKYYILGARKGLDNHGMSDRDMIKLRPGDEITTLHYAVDINNDEDDFTQVEVETFTVTENTHVADEQLGDGNYAYAFDFVTPTDDSASSNFILFTITGGEITTNVDVQ